ncbi:MAG: oligopeptide transport system substrate-binding protein [Paracoccaceae bacterium]
MFRNLIFPALASFAFILTSCDSRSDVEVANEANILIIGNKGEPKGLDPQLVSGVMESNLIRALFEGLCVEHPSKDGEVLPGAAASWVHNEDYSEWTFSLQTDGKWSDGVPITAEDFAFSYRRMISPDPAWPAKYASMLYFIENAEAYHKTQLGKILCGNDESFPLTWEILKETNFAGDPLISAANFKGKEFSELKEAELADFHKYLDEGETVSIKNLANKKFDKLSSSEKKIFLNLKGLDHLDVDQLGYVQKNLNALKWSEGTDDTVKQEVISRILQFQKTEDKPDLWEKAQVGVEAVDDFTLKLTMRGPVDFLPELSTHYTWFPVPKHIILQYGKINTAFASQWTKEGNMVSNGAFKLKKWRTNHFIEVEKNPAYWDTETVSLAGIRYLPIGNNYTETRMYGDEQLHLTYTVPAELIPFAKKEYPNELRQEAYVGTRFARINTERDPFKDPKVRRAFALAIDQAAFCDNILMGGQTPASGIVPPLAGYPVSDKISFQPEKARQLLKESSWGDKEIPTLTFLTTDSDGGRTEAEVIQSMLKEHLGVEVRIIQREWSTYLQLQRDGDYDLSAAGWIGDYLDPTTFLEMWRRGDGNNNTGWSSKEFERLLDEAGQIADPTTRIATLAKAEAIFLDENPVLPIYFYTTNYLIRPEVKGWHPLLLNNHPFKFVKIEK